jgi:transposase
MEVVCDGCWRASAGDPGDARADVVAGSAVGGAAGGSAAVLASDRAGSSSEQAAAAAGVSQAVGSRWFRDGGGMPPISLAPLSGRYLSFAEREEIAILHAQRVGVREIARRLKRSASTISRELRRNASTRSHAITYRATTAQWHAERRASRPKVSKLASNDALRELRTGARCGCRALARRRAARSSSPKR